MGIQCHLSEIIALGAIVGLLGSKFYNRYKEPLSYYMNILKLKISESLIGKLFTAIKVKIIDCVNSLELKISQTRIGKAFTTIKSKIKNFFGKKDIPYPWQCGFQDPASPAMAAIIDLHHTIMFYVVMVVFFVLFVLIQTLLIFSETNDYKQQIMHHWYSNHIKNLNLERAWTVVPILILLSIAGPSFALLYALDEIYDPELTVKVVGNQWY